MKTKIFKILSNLLPFKKHDDNLRYTYQKPNITKYNALKFALYYFKEEETYAVGIIFNNELVTISDNKKFESKKFEFCNNALREIFDENVDVYPEIILGDTNHLFQVQNHHKNGNTSCKKSN